MERQLETKHLGEAIKTDSQEAMTVEEWCKEFLQARVRGVEANCHLMDVGTTAAKEKAVRLGGEVIRVLERFPVKQRSGI